MNKENNNAYSKLKFLFSSRDILNQHWESDNQNNSNHWKNERFDLCAIGDSEFSDVQCQEFNTHYFSEDFMILTPCHSMISQPDEAIRAMLDTGIIDIPEKLQFKNACDPVAITSLNGENNRTFLNYLALMSDKINYFVVTCYWKTECDKRQSYGFMPAYILTRNPNAKDAISSEEFHKFENSLSQIFHLTCNCSHSAAASFIQMHTQTGDMPVPYDNIADTLDLFFRMQLSDPKTENSTELLSVRYLSPESPDEFSKNRRITRGEIFWQTTAKEKVA